MGTSTRREQVRGSGAYRRGDRGGRAGWSAVVTEAMRCSAPPASRPSRAPASGCGCDSRRLNDAGRCPARSFREDAIADRARRRVEHAQRKAASPRDRTFVGATSGRAACAAALAAGAAALAAGAAGRATLAAIPAPATGIALSARAAGGSRLRVRAARRRRVVVAPAEAPREERAGPPSSPSRRPARPRASRTRRARGNISKALDPCHRERGV